VTTLAVRAGVLGAALVLEHVPDLVRYGSKPMREQARLPELTAALRTYEQVLAYPPHQVFLGNLRPEELWELSRPWWKTSESNGVRPPTNGRLKFGRTGPYGELMPQDEYYRLLEELDQFDLVKLGAEPNESAGEIPLFDGGQIVGAFAPAHERDEALQATVLLENLACKASGVHALRVLLEQTGADPGSIEYAVGCGEEAIGDRYQRGGGALAKAIAEACGLERASGADVKAFCAAPVHALIVAGALVESGAYERVVVVAGGSLAKLGMKFVGALDHGVPVLEDVLAGMAVLVGPAADVPVLRLDAVGRHQIGSGSSQQALLTDIVVRPLERLGRKITDVERYSTELHDPEITEPGGGGDVPDRNYRMLAGLAVLRGELDKAAIPGFAREHGLPGFAPTQGHIASAVPWLPHALERLAAGELRSTMLMAKGSLFLGRMTQLWDGASITLEG
jgi:glycine/sarcosine/betaine reductase complex component C subunit beta